MKIKICGMKYVEEVVEVDDKFAIVNEIKDDTFEEYYRVSEENEEIFDELLDYVTENFEGPDFELYGVKNIDDHLIAEI